MSPTRAGITAALLLIAFLVGCSSKPGQRDQMMALLEAEDWVEIKARATVLRGEDFTAPWLDFAEGMALLHENADKSAIRLFDRSIAADPEFAVKAGAKLSALAFSDLENDWTDRATRRMRNAILYDSSINPGDLADRVGDRFYRFDKDQISAFPIYERLALERPEPVAKHPEWVFRYGHCLEERGERDAALAVYDEFLKEFRGEQGQTTYVHWRRMMVMLDFAKEAREQSRPIDALAFISKAIAVGWHRDLQQRARYLAGEIEEERGELENARDWYAEIIENGGETGGDVTDRARVRLEALKKLGVH